MRKLLWFILLFPLVSSGQDLSLSQYHLVENLVNPASTGSGPSDIKAVLAHKRQWGAVSTPFVTSLFAAEWNPFLSKRRSNQIAFGLVAITDKGGSAGYSAGIYRLTSAYHLKLNKTKQLSFGLELGYNQRRFNLDGLAWDSQFNGVAYDPSLPTGEFWSGAPVGYFDAGFGMEFQNKNLRKLYWKSGVAFHHYYQGQTVLENGEDLLPTLGQVYFQGQQTNGYMMYRYYLLLQSQNLSAYSGTIGADVSYRFNYDSRYTSFSTSSAATIGVFYRYRDAIIPTIGFEYKRMFRLSLAYDINISRLTTASNFNGGPEINFTYYVNFNKSRRRFR